MRRFLGTTFPPSMPILFMLVGVPGSLPGQQAASREAAAERATASQQVVGFTVEQTRGVDQQVRYQQLLRLGPWDERNYRLTRADLALLAPNEEELRDPIPVFFRVEMRRAWPELPREGPVQYPRSALQIFLQQYGGYLVDNRLYTRATADQREFRILRADPAAAAGAPARFLEGEVRVSTPSGGAESAIKASPADPNLVIAGSNGPGAGQVMHYSSDGGETWTASSLPLGGTCCDPTVDWSSDGSLAYAATLGNCTLGGCGVWFYRSSDNGVTWTDLASVPPGDPRRELTNSGSDKEYLHVDKFAGSSCLDNLYLTWHDANVMQFARSTDQGNTWSTPAAFGSDPRGIGSDITTDKSGAVYYFWPGTSSQQILLKRSTDCGATFQTGVTQVATTNGAFDFPIPSMETRRAWIYVSADADLSNGPFAGSIYAAWTDTSTPEDNINAQNNHTVIQVAYSRDQGNTWTIVTPHETADVNTVDRWNQWLAVGADGTVHLVFYDTRNSTGRTGVDLYYSSSTDGAQTFSAPQRLTGTTSPNLTDFFEFGDYNGLDFLAGEYIAVFTDNRAEAGGTGDSQDIYAAAPARAGPPGPGGISTTLILWIIIIILLLLLIFCLFRRRASSP